MRKPLQGVWCLLIAFCFAASPALAERAIHVEPLPEATVTPIDIAGPNPFDVGQTCQVGNLNPIAYAITGFALPPEEYKLVYDPQLGCSACPAGHQINTIHVFIRTSQACQVVMGVDVEEVSDLVAACPGRSPGVEECNSGLYTVNIPAGGVYNVGIPIQCGCLTMNRLYLMSFWYESSSCLPEPDLITDAFPSACTSWNNFGPGWTDIVTAYGFPGNLSMFADAECCSPPVPTEDKTWGGVKSLYDN